MLSRLHGDTGAGVSPQAGRVSVGRDSASAPLCLLGWPRPCSLATGHQGPGAQGPPGRPCHHTSPRFPRTSPALPTTPHPGSSQHTPLGLKALARADQWAGNHSPETLTQPALAASALLPRPCPPWRTQGLPQGSPWGSQGTCGGCPPSGAGPSPPRGAVLQMRAADRPAPGVDGAAGPRGLSLLVQQVLGKPLDKMQQLSNWDRRPLCEGQLVYAGGRPPHPCPAPPIVPTLEAEADLACPSR